MSAARSRAAWVFTLALGAGVAAETLLLAEGQCRRLESALSDDFRVVLFLRHPLEDSKRKVLEEKLRAQPETAELRYVPPEEALSALRREDPELVDAIALVGENPLPGAFEVTPAADALPRLASWLDGAQELGDWSDVRWKQAQLQAILRARLYSRWLRLTLSTLLCLGAGLALWALLAHVRSSARSAPRLTIAGALGGAVGLGAAALAAGPLARDELLWAWPAAWSQAAVVAACGALGWSFSLWRSES